MFNSVRLKIAFLIMSMYFIISCSPNVYKPPKEYNIEKQSLINCDYETTCQKIISFFEEHNIFIRNFDKESGLLVTEFEPDEDFIDKYFDCGTLPNPNMYKIEKFSTPNTNILIILKKINHNQTGVEIRVLTAIRIDEYDMYYGAVKATYDVLKNSLDGNNKIISCNSKGRFEKAFFEYIGK